MPDQQVLSMPVNQLLQATGEQKTDQRGKDRTRRDQNR
jgi:hypothetical protein